MGYNDEIRNMGIRDVLNPRENQSICIKNGEVTYLDDRSEQFCKNIVAGMGIIASYRNAFDKNASDSVALSMGKSLAITKNISDRIMHLETNRRIVRDIDRDEMLSDLKKMYLVNISDYFDVDELTNVWHIKPPDRWTPEMKRACTKIKPTRFGIELEIEGKEWLFNNMKNIVSIGTQETKEINQYDNKTLEELKKTVIDLGEVLNPVSKGGSAGDKKQKK